MTDLKTTRVQTLVQLLEKDVWRAVTFALGATTDVARDCLCSKDDALQGEARIRAFRHCLEIAIHELQLICEGLDSHAEASSPPQIPPLDPVQTSVSPGCQSLQPPPG